MKYKKAPKYIVVNDNDPDLQPIKIPLPKAPPPEDINGYGKDPKDQKFKRTRLTRRLFDLNKKRIALTEKSAIINDDQESWEDEIAFIQREWDRRENGYWFYNNGAPTYMTGLHYIYCVYWRIDVGFPEYRNRDRKFFIFTDFCDNDPDCFGFVYPKHRREGATHKAACWNYEGVSRKRRVRGGIQSMTELHAKTVFTKHLVPGWKYLPFFFQPVYEGTTNPKKELSFNAPAIRVTSSNMGEQNIDALGSSIDYGSSDKGFYDGSKLFRYHIDELGKTTEVDVYDRWLVAKQTLSIGAKIVGMAIGTSTAGEMKKGGGRQFKKLCNASDYYARDDNNRTISGLYRLFLPATDGMEGFVDEYGNSLVSQAATYLNNEKKAALDVGDFKKHSEITRQFPTRYRECFRSENDTCNFNRKILEERLDYFSVGENKHLNEGDFVWEDGIVDGKVKFVSRRGGKFKVSYLFPTPADSNKFFYSGGVKVPGNTALFSAGADPFKFKTTLAGKKSNGAGAVFMKHDTTIDPPTIDASEWKTHRFVCTYDYRPREKAEYGEDMLMMSVYYGCFMLPEINIPFVWDYFTDRGYDGYLFYDVDKKTNKYKKTPGLNTNEAVKEDIYREYHAYIQHHTNREVHDDLLRQCLEIEDDMTDYDLFVAGGYALLCARKGNYASLQSEKKSVDLLNYYQQF